MCSGVLQKRPADATPSQRRPDSEVREQQHLLAAIQLADHAAEQRFVSAECDGRERLRRRRPS